uniref:Uncharacterized protein n=1 Tax=Timema douglasi TaxID=61478 RepID=A0A7R8VI21_TIMDO|nr:unnamed protein product [Timema douglasi]
MEADPAFPLVCGERGHTHGIRVFMRNEPDCHATQHNIQGSNNEAVVHYIIKPETTSIVPASGVCGELEPKEELCFDEKSIIISENKIKAFSENFTNEINKNVEFQEKDDQLIQGQGLLSKSSRNNNTAMVCSCNEGRKGKETKEEMGGADNSKCATILEDIFQEAAAVAANRELHKCRELNVSEKERGATRFGRRLKHTHTHEEVSGHSDITEILKWPGLVPGLPRLYSARTRRICPQHGAGHIDDRDSCFPDRPHALLVLSIVLAYRPKYQAYSALFADHSHRGVLPRLAGVQQRFEPSPSLRAIQPYLLPFLLREVEHCCHHAQHLSPTVGGGHKVSKDEVLQERPTTNTGHGHSPLPPPYWRDLQQTQATVTHLYPHPIGPKITFIKPYYNSTLSQWLLESIERSKQSHMLVLPRNSWQPCPTLLKASQGASITQVLAVGNVAARYVGPLLEQRRVKHRLDYDSQNVMDSVQPRGQGFENDSKIKSFEALPSSFKAAMVSVFLSSCSPKRAAALKPSLASDS